MQSCRIIDSSCDTRGLCRLSFQFLTMYLLKESYEYRPGYKSDKISSSYLFFDTGDFQKAGLDFYVPGTEDYRGRKYFFHR